MTYAKKLKPLEFSFPRGKGPRLGQLDIELTERCNNNCIHCLINRPENDDHTRDKEMDTAFVKDILKQAADLGCLTVRFTGGEPLLREDFAELYMFARRLGMDVILFTNGRLITPELARLFAKYPPGKPIEISVYGMHPESYDGAAGKKGAYEEFRRGIEQAEARELVNGVEIRPIRTAEREQWNSLMKRHHYLGFNSLIGQSLQYVAVRENRWLALLGWSAAALKCKARDEWIGWTPALKLQRLPLVVNNSRFLILPSVSVPNLASRVFSLNLKRLSHDWQAAHGHPIYLAETL